MISHSWDIGYAKGHIHEYYLSTGIDQVFPSIVCEHARSPLALSFRLAHAQYSNPMLHMHKVGTRMAHRIKLYASNNHPDVQAPRRGSHQGQLTRNPALMRAAPQHMSSVEHPYAYGCDPHVSLRMHACSFWLVLSPWSSPLPIRHESGASALPKVCTTLHASMHMHCIPNMSYFSGVGRIA